MSDYPYINYYHVLEVEPNASQEDIQIAYNKKSKSGYSDKQDVLQTDNDQYLITDAYKILANPIERKNYDHFLAEHPLLNEKSNDIVSYTLGNDLDNISLAKNSDLISQHKATYTNISTLLHNSKISVEYLQDLALNHLNFGLQLFCNPHNLSFLSKEELITFILTFYKKVLNDPVILPAFIKSQTITSVMNNISNYYSYFKLPIIEPELINQFIKEYKHFFNALETEEIASLVVVAPCLFDLLLTKERMQKLSINNVESISHLINDLLLCYNFNQYYYDMLKSTDLFPKKYIEKLIQEVFWGGLFSLRYKKNDCDINLSFLTKLLEIMDINDIFEIMKPHSSHSDSLAAFFQWYKATQPKTKYDKLNFSSNDEIGLIFAFSKAIFRSASFNCSDYDILLYSSRELEPEEWFSTYPYKKEEAINFLIEKNIEIKKMSKKWRKLIVEQLFGQDMIAQDFFDNVKALNKKHVEYFQHNNLWRHLKKSPETLARYAALPTNILIETVSTRQYYKDGSLPDCILKIYNAKEKLSEFTQRGEGKILFYDEYNELVNITGTYKELFLIKYAAPEVMLDISKRLLSRSDIYKDPEFAGTLSEYCGYLVHMFKTGVSPEVNNNLIELVMHSPAESLSVFKSFVMPLYKDYIHWGLLNALICYDFKLLVKNIPIIEIMMAIEHAKKERPQEKLSDSFDSFIAHPEIANRYRTFQTISKIFSDKDKTRLLRGCSPIQLVEMAVANDFYEPVSSGLFGSYDYFPALSAAVAILLLSVKPFKFSSKNDLIYLKHICKKAKLNNLHPEEYNIEVAKLFIESNANKIEGSKLSSLYHKFGTELDEIYKRLNLFERMQANEQLSKLLKQSRTFGTVKIEPKTAFQDSINQLENSTEKYLNFEKNVLSSELDTIDKTFCEELKIQPSEIFTSRNIKAMTEAQLYLLRNQPDMAKLCDRIVKDEEFFGPCVINLIIPVNLTLNDVNTKAKMQGFFMRKLKEFNFINTEAMRNLRLNFPKCHKEILSLLANNSAPLNFARELNTFLQSHFYFELCQERKRIAKEGRMPNRIYQSFVKTAITNTFRNLDLDKENDQIIKEKINASLDRQIKILAVPEVGILSQAVRFIFGSLFAISSAFLLCINPSFVNYFFNPNMKHDQYKRMQKNNIKMANGIKLDNATWIQSYLNNHEFKESICMAEPAPKKAALSDLEAQMVPSNDNHKKVGEIVHDWKHASNYKYAKIISAHRYPFSSYSKMCKSAELLYELEGSTMTINKGMG